MKRLTKVRCSDSKSAAEEMEKYEDEDSDDGSLM